MDSQDSSHGSRFKPGVSGNPNGRSKGSRNKASKFIEMLDERGSDVVEKFIDKALEGDPVALKLYIPRLIPRRTARSIELDLPEIMTITDAAAASKIVLAAVSNGVLTLDEGTKLMSLIESLIKVQAHADLEARVAELDSKFAHSNDERARGGE